MHLIKGRILFFIFVILCGSLLILQQAADVLTDTYYANIDDIPNYAVGEVYRATWNGRDDFVLNNDKFNILIRGKYLSEEIIEKIRNSEFIKIQTAFELPEKSGNPGEFDMREYLSAKAIDLISFPEDDDIIFFDKSQAYGDFHSMYFYGAEIREYIENTLIKYSDENTASVSLSVMTGDSRIMSSDTKSLFQKAGLSHLMAVSGAHVAFISDPVKKLLNCIKNRHFDVKVKNIICVPFIIMLLVIAGFTPSVTRAVIMCLCSVIAVLCCRKYDPLNSLGLAGIITIMINPCCIFDTGFILSYCACICIYIIFPLMKNIKLFSSVRGFKGITDGVLCSVAVNIGLLPLLINLFNGFSALSILINVFASPIAKMIFTGSCLISIAETLFLPPSFCGILSLPLTTAVSALEKCASFSDGGFPGYIEIASVPSRYMLFYYAVLILVLLFLYKVFGSFFKYISIVTMTAVCFLFCRLSPADVELLFFDVGQGISVLLSSGGYNGIIDTGTGYTDIEMLLKKQSISKLDFIVISHGHSDHCGGFEKLIENIECDVVFFPDNTFDEKIEELSMLAEENGISVCFVDGIRNVTVGEHVSMKLICYSDNKNINNSSVIVSLYGEWGSVLLPGDIESESELKFISDFDENVDLLCVAHHGSDTSSDSEFLKTLAPEYAIISVGEDNLYNHPSSGVIDRVDNYTVDGVVYRTDLDGAVKFSFGVFLDIYGEGISIWQKKRSVG